MNLIRAFISGFIIVALSMHSALTYGDFSYDIDRFTVIGGATGTAMFVDEFDDDLEPPSGPSGPFTYGVNVPLSANRESGGFLNLNSDDTVLAPGGDEETVIVNMNDGGFSINPGSGGSVEGRFRLQNGVATGSWIELSIFSAGPSFFEAVILTLDKRPFGRIFASLESELSLGDTESDETISEVDITDMLSGTTDVAFRLDIDSSNRVTAALVFGNGDSLVMPGSHVLTFAGGTNYAGSFGAVEICLVSDVIFNPDGSADISLVNDCLQPIPIELKIWAELDDTAFPILSMGSDGSFILPSGFQTTVPLAPAGWVQSAPSGLAVGIRFLDPVTGEELSFDAEVVP